MPSRSGCRVLDALGATSVFARDLGEDWVVPKAAVRYLVVRAGGRALLVTAYGEGGQIVGERVFADLAAGAAAKRRLVEGGLVEPWRDIPDDAPSATRFLDGVRSP